MALRGVGAAWVTWAATSATTLGIGFGNMAGSDIDADALLADALGITVDDLQAARTQVFDDRLAQAVTDGNLTQAEADLMKAQRSLSEYVAPLVQSAYDDAVTAAVADGVITQAQADALAAQGGQGMRGFGPGMDDGFGHRGGRGMDDMGGPGQRGGRGDRQSPGTSAPNAPSTDDSTGSNG